MVGLGLAQVGLIVLIHGQITGEVLEVSGSNGNNDGSVTETINVTGMAGSQGCVALRFYYN